MEYSFVVIDIECFHNNTIKEIGISSPFFNMGYSFKPPQCFKSLPFNEQKQNNWLTRHCHGITWESGIYPYAMIPALLGFFNNAECKVFVKGKQKINVLKLYMPLCTFTDLEDMFCPPYSELCAFTELHHVPCTSFPSTHNSAMYESHCAQHKASIYSSWLLVNRYHNSNGSGTMLNSLL